MRLFDTPRAPNPRRVRWVMAEKGIDDIEIVTLNILDGAHKTPEYLARAGAPVVPALEMDDGTTITESIAICRYLESRYPEPNLFGRTPEETAFIEMWLRRAEMLVAQPLMMTVRLSHPALAVLESPSPAVADYTRANGLAGLELIDRRLGESEWLAGDRLTIADIVAFAGVDFTRMIRLQLPENLKNLGRLGGRDAGPAGGGPVIRIAVAAAALALAGAAQAQSLEVRGLDGAVRTLSATEIAALPRGEADLVEDGKPHHYEGASLSAVLRAGGLPMGARLHGDPLKAYLVVTGADGFQAVYSLAEVDREFHGDNVILADRVDGGPLPEKRAPWRLVSSGDRKGWRAVYAVTRLEARSILTAHPDDPPN